MNGPSTNAQRHRRVLSLFLATGLYWGIAAAPAFAQGDQPQAAPDKKPPAASATQANEDQSTDAKPSAQDKAKSKKKRKRRGEFVIAPIPISSPALGSGIVPVVAYIFPLSTADKISPPSVVAATGVVTNNGTRAFALGGQLFFKEDTYEVATGFAKGNLNYDLYGLGSGASQLKLPLNQTGKAFFGQVFRRIGWKFFAGPRFFAGNSLITVRSTDVGSAPLPPDLGFNTTLTALGFGIKRDTRPNRFYATTGTLLTFNADFFSEALGSKYSFQSYNVTFNKYWSLSKNQVLAYNAFACFTGGQPPFYGNCIYGTQNELRGYTAGRYLDRYMLATQYEYRLTLPKRFGLVWFGGVGEVIPGGNQLFRNKNFLPSGGAGVRFEVSKAYHVNLRADFAQGIGSHTWSIGVGEAF